MQFQFRNITLTNHRTHNTPLFDFAEVLDLLECPENAQWELDEDEIAIAHGSKWLTEPGLYHLIMQSEAPVAQEFRRWTQAVMVNIYLTGKHDGRAVLN
jgi:prophage antirepressor-like protein